MKTTYTQVKCPHCRGLAFLLKRGKNYRIICAEGAFVHRFRLNRKHVLPPPQKGLVLK
jgi:hypothetical protein